MPTRARSTGLSGLAVTFAALGGWLVYSSVRDMDPVNGLGEILSGNQPTSRSEGGAKRGLATGSGGANVAGNPGDGKPVTKDTTVLVRPPDDGPGIRVHSSIATATRNLLAAAYKAGFTDVAGGGWRSLTEQRALRLAHGYLSDAEPSGSLGRTPTARPGQSRHEMGRAIDFTNKGRSLTRSDPFFTWLTVNAGTYGFSNLPSEAWHWSTDGK